MMAETPLVLPRSTCSANGLAEVGGKAANLGELVRAGFAVPDGFVVTTAGYDLAVAGTDLAQLVEAGDAAGIARLFDTVALPPELTDAIAGASHVRSTGGEVVIIPLLPDRSTTRLVERLRVSP